jgi:hypothetical protein
MESSIKYWWVKNGKGYTLFRSVHSGGVMEYYKTLAITESGTQLAHKTVRLSIGVSASSSQEVIIPLHTKRVRLGGRRHKILCLKSTSKYLWLEASWQGMEQVPSCWQTDKRSWIRPVRCRRARLLQWQDNNDEEIASSFHHATKTITESRYQKVDVEIVSKQQMHLSSKQQDQLLSVLQKRTKLFSGELRLYTGKNMDLELIPGAVPVHQKPYPVPHAHMEVFHKELVSSVSLDCYNVLVELNGQHRHSLRRRKTARYDGYRTFGN